MNQNTNISETQIQREDTIDIKKFVFKILSSWYWFVFTISVAVFAAWLVNRYTDPIYTLSSTLIIQDKENSITGGIESILEEQGIFRRSRKKSVDNEVAVLKSYSLTQKAISQLPEFHISYFTQGRIRTFESYKASSYKVIIDTLHKNLTEKPIDVKLLNNKQCQISFDIEEQSKKVKINYNEWFESEDFRFKILPNFKNEPKINSVISYFFIIRDTLKLIEQYRGKLNITTTDKKSTILELSSSGLVPQKEVDFLNKLMEVYVQSGLDEKNQIAINTIYFIDEQLSEISDSLTVTEDKLSNFRQSNKLIDISQEGAILYQKTERIQSEKSMLILKGKYYQYLLDYISKERDFSDVMSPSVLDINDIMLTGLITELTNLYKERNNYNYSSNKTNPGVELVNFKIKSTLADLKENIINIINTNEIAISEVDKKIALADIEMSKLPATEKELIGINRHYKMNDEIYTYLLTKRAEAGIAKASNIPDNKILDYARENSAALISPKKSLNYIIAIIIGLLIPIIIIVVVDFFNDKIIERKDIESQTNIPILGEVGHNSKGTEMVVFERPKSSIAEAFRTLRTNLLYFNIDRKDPCFIITITSTISGEGKSFCAINLASVFAIGEKKTLLMGIDLRKPKLHRELGFDNLKGLSTYLVGTHRLDEVILPTQQNNLFFLPAGPVPPNPAELIETRKMENLMTKLKEEYEIIIIDTPPVAMVTDAILLTKYSDINLFVLRQNFSRRNMIKLINEVFQERGFKNVGILINDISVQGYYGYSYYGNYGYGKYTYKYGYGRYGYGYGSGYYDDDNSNGNGNASGGFFASIFSRKKK